MPVSATTKAQLVYQGGSNRPVLRLDKNGSGTFNTQIQPSSVVGTHSLDTTPPATTITVSGGVVTLSAVDNPGGTGVLNTEYSLDGGVTYQLYTNPFTINQVGITTILARSTDREGNVEDPPVSLTIH